MTQVKKSIAETSINKFYNLLFKMANDNPQDSVVFWKCIFSESWEMAIEEAFSDEHTLRLCFEPFLELKDTKNPESIVWRHFAQEAVRRVIEEGAAPDPIKDLWMEPADVKPLEGVNV